MVLGIFLLAFFFGYLVRAGIRLVAGGFSSHGRKSKHSRPAAVPAIRADDEPFAGWTALDEVQLTRLLRDSAPQ